MQARTQKSESRNRGVRKPRVENKTPSWEVRLAAEWPGAGTGRYGLKLYICLSPAWNEMEGWKSSTNKTLNKHLIFSY